jgi:hypothetical protein
MDHDTSSDITLHVNGAIHQVNVDNRRTLLDALREAEPNRGCWTWWGTSQSPQTSGAVARHQLQQLAVHTYDAQVTVGAPEPLSSEVALDGVDEFLTTCCAGTEPWPHEPAVVDYHATEGRSWRLWLSADGARVARHPTPGTRPAGEDPADASAEGTASDLVLVFYGRIPLDTLKMDGDRQLFDRLVEAWPERTIVPSLAERWEISDDGLRYVFHLREGLAWSAGAPHTAHDIEFGIRSISSMPDMYRHHEASA